MFRSSTLWLLALGPAALATGCTSFRVEEDLPLTPAEITDVQVSTGALVTAYAPTAPELEVSALRARAPITITVVGTTNARVRVGGYVVKTNEPVELTLDRLARDQVVHIEHLDANGALVDQSLKTLPADFPELEVTADNPTPGQVFFNSFTWKEKNVQSYCVMTDEQGTPLFYLRPPKNAFDFTWHDLSGGRTRYSYSSDGLRHILDESFKPIATFPVAASDTHGEHDVDDHDFIMLDDNHYIVGALIDKEVTNVPYGLADLKTPIVQAAVLQEVVNGQVVFEWDSTDHPELYDAASDGRNYAGSTKEHPADYIHFNSIQIDPKDGNWIVSFRHQDAILKIDRGTGKILWTLGGKLDDFGLTPEQKFSHQHFARYQPDGSILFFDNGNARKATRIVKLSIDEQAHKLTSFTEWPGNRYSFAMGSVQELDTSAYFIGWGARTPDVEDVTEVDPLTGKVRFSLRLGGSLYSYRAVKRVLR